MMRPAAGITVALVVHLLAGVVGAASLPPDDQYSPQRSTYRRDVSQGPRGYPNWLQYPQEPSTEFEPSETKSAITTLRASDLSWETKIREDSVIRDPDLLPLSPTRWSVAPTGVTDNSTDRASFNLDVPEDAEISSETRDDLFVADDTFQDQGPGSVEVYKLDLLRENSLLVPEAKRKQQQQLAAPRIKSKNPKKTNGEEILWKLKPIEPSKASLPTIFRQPPRIQRVDALPKIEENRKDEVFAVGGVPELQVGCEGLEASDRRKRSNGPGEETIDDTDPSLWELPSIILDLEHEPPSEEAYEEMDELLKLKNLENTSPTPKPKRRADIDPALFETGRHDVLDNVGNFPERGDLGSTNNRHVKQKRSIRPEETRERGVEDERYRGTNDLKDDEASSSSAEGRSAGRKLLWVEHPERQKRSGYRPAVHNSRNDQDDLWGFDEYDGAISGNEDESVAEQLRKAEMEKRRREYERRRHKELERRPGGHGRHPHSQEHRSRDNDVDAEIEMIRQAYERQLEKEQRELRRIEHRGRHETDRGHREEERRRVEEAHRRRDEETRRRMEEVERNRQGPPSPLTRPEDRVDNRSRSQQEHRDEEERKLREYMERNRPIDPKNRDDEGRRHTEEERKRQQIEEQRRRQQQRDEEERRRQAEEQRRRQQQPDEAERRRQMEEQRRRQQQPDEEERRRQLEEQRRRQQQPDEEERRRQMEDHRRRQQQPDEHERRRQMEEQRRRQQSEDGERRRQMEEQRRRQQSEDEERRRQMEEQRRRQQSEEEERRRLRPKDRTMEEERRHRLEEEKKLQEYVRRNQPINVPRRNNSEILTSPDHDLDEQRRTLEAARQYERDRIFPSRTNDPRSHGPSAPTNSGHRQSPVDLEEIQRRREAEYERRRLQDEERRREEEYRRVESRRREEDRLRLEAIRRNEENRRSQSETRRPSWQDSGSSRRPTNIPHRGSVDAEVRDREAEEFRRREATQRTSNNSMRNQDNEWRRRFEERERQRIEQEERERDRMENERNSRYNGRRRPHYEDTGFNQNRHRGESARFLEERRRQEHVRLNSLPISARIILRSNNGTATSPTPNIGSRNNFDNDVNRPGLHPNRPGLDAGRYPAPSTRRPLVKSPGPCVWAIVQCCPGNNHLTRCFEAMGCPGINWDPNPCRGSLADSARAQVMRFYEAEDERN